MYERQHPLGKEELSLFMTTLRVFALDPLVLVIEQAYLSFPFLCGPMQCCNVLP